jgi:hypothetical protein
MPGRRPTWQAVAAGGTSIGAGDAGAAEHGAHAIDLFTDNRTSRARAEFDQRRGPRKYDAPGGRKPALDYRKKVQSAEVQSTRFKARVRLRFKRKFERGFERG